MDGAIWARHFMLHVPFVSSLSKIKTKIHWKSTDSSKCKTLSCLLLRLLIHDFWYDDYFSTGFFSFSSLIHCKQFAPFAFVYVIIGLFVFKIGNGFTSSKRAFFARKMAHTAILVYVSRALLRFKPWKTRIFNANNRIRKKAILFDDVKCEIFHELQWISLWLQRDHRAKKYAFLSHSMVLTSSKKAVSISKPIFFRWADCF